MSDGANMERRVVQLEQAVKRVDRAMAQLLEITGAVCGLTISMVSALISSTDLPDGVKAAMNSAANDLKQRMRWDTGDNDES